MSRWKIQSGIGERTCPVPASRTAVGIKPFCKGSDAASIGRSKPIDIMANNRPCHFFERTRDPEHPPCFIKIITSLFRYQQLHNTTPREANQQK